MSYLTILWKAHTLVMHTVARPAEEFQQLIYINRLKLHLKESLKVFIGREWKYRVSYNPKSIYLFKKHFHFVLFTENINTDVYIAILYLLVPALNS